MRSKQGFTLLEVLMVTGIIALLLASLFAATAQLRARAAKNKTIALLEKIYNGLEGYKLQFRVYPPHDFVPGAGDASLRYFLSSAFRVTPDSAAGEITASVDAGPLVRFNDDELANGRIVDAWGSPICYERIQQEDLTKAQKLDVLPWYDPTRSMSAGSRALITSYICKLYSLGINRRDDGGAADDLMPGK